MTVRGTTIGRRRRSAVAMLASAVLLGTAACSAGTGGDQGSDAADQGAAAMDGSAVAHDTPDVSISDNVTRRHVAVDTKVRVSAEDGTLEHVRVYGGPEGEKERIPGKITADGTVWRAGQLLEPGGRYTIRTVAVDDEDRVLRDKRRFRTENLTLDEQTYPNIAPLEGETVGVGMPVIIKFDIPVTDKTAIERHLSVEAEPAVRGAWHWYSDTEVHFRPRHLWEPGSRVTINADVNSIDAGNGIYGQLDRSVSFNVGHKVVSKIHVRQHRMKVFINDKLARTIPVSAGKAGFETRSGTKIVMEKYRKKRMDARTIGIEPGDPDYYNIPDVYWALRVTTSGEFVHGAPWSIGDQGEANVSHGCVGMSLDDAKWLYERTHRGDVVMVTGTDRELEPGNGWTDWNVSFAKYKRGSALS